MIDRYVRGEELRQVRQPRLPKVYIEPCATGEEGPTKRVKPPCNVYEKGGDELVEVEQTLSEEDARREALRCLRCDLEFTAPEENGSDSVQTGAAITVEAAR